MVWLVRHQDVENSIFYMYKNPSGQENIRGYKVGAGKQKATTIKGTVGFRIWFPDPASSCTDGKENDNAIQ